MGYVGLPLAIAFSEHYTVFGYDIDDLRISNLQNGIDTNFDIDFDIDSNLKLTNHIESLKNCNIYIITVPTPIKDDKSPDLSYLIEATKMFGEI